MTELAAIGIVTRDVRESARFYRELGLDVPEPPAGEDHFEITLPNGLRLMWDTVELIRRIDAGWEEPTGQRTSLAFACDVDAVHAKLVAAGFESRAEPWDAFWGQRYAQVLDPDGNVVDLFRTL
jgi:catechol 2,3-dioxygenase-like lactoylglutathione lyase family enzyme